MIKVKNIREQKLSEITNNYIGIISVIDAELVLVECKPEEALFFRQGSEPYQRQINSYSFEYGLVKGIGKYLKPIQISRTEKIEEGDWYYYNGLIIKCENVDLINIVNVTKGKCFKILALPEHFSPEQLKQIVEGKLKEGKYLLECDPLFESLFNGVNPPAFIKLNPYIIIYDFVDKMYTRKELREVIEQYQDFTESNSLLTTDQWFELNVK